MGTSKDFYGPKVHKNGIYNPVPPKNPLETIETPMFANLHFRPPPFSSIFTIGNPIVNQLLRVAIFMDFVDFHGFSLKNHEIFMVELSKIVGNIRENPETTKNNIRSTPSRFTVKKQSKNQHIFIFFAP